MYTVIFNYWRRAAFLFLLGLLLFCYVGFPDSIAYQHNGVGRPIGFIDKQTFFYLSVGIIVGLNLLFGVVKSQFEKIDFQKLIPNNAWTSNQEQLKDLLSGWFNAIQAFINTYLVFALMGLKSINLEVEQNLDRDYTWFLVIGAVVLIALIFSVPLKILFSNPPKN
ncbi:hypothetical protein [Arcticibacterium luteifluviistationis]|uniref:DUF1648 domain-containing protein n=1 Tax=Arcticibacterium luteifluviistationis TaxID=1784714 RepID=A0A2Z4GG14_9BACT|nr:hypothetical protein [Arcticibacterium luteifluviistationis]AWV99924.1 hypothetical protein DJ013_17805 [Arcticibacterium luteifluviistationis]